MDPIGRSATDFCSTTRRGRGAHAGAAPVAGIQDRQGARRCPARPGAAEVRLAHLAAPRALRDRRSTSRSRLVSNNGPHVAIRGYRSRAGPATCNGVPVPSATLTQKKISAWRWDVANVFCAAPAWGRTPRRRRRRCRTARARPLPPDRLAVAANFCATPQTSRDASFRRRRRSFDAAIATRTCAVASTPQSAARSPSTPRCARSPRSPRRERVRGSRRACRRCSSRASRW